MLKQQRYTLYAICFFSNLTQKIDSKSEEMLYIYNYERNRALINIIVDGLCDIKKLSQEI